MSIMMRENTGKKKKRAWNLFFIALPLILLVFLFNYVPLLGWFLSFIEYKPGYPILTSNIVGFKYFELLFKSNDIKRVLINTVLFSTINFFLLPLPMIFAILLNEITYVPFRKSAQIFTTLPNFIGWVIVYSLAFSIFGSDGMLNQILTMLRIDPQAVLGDRNAVYWFQSLVGIWKTMGWIAIIYIAAITGINPQLYEAAVVDGAGRLRSVLHITLPCLMPTFVVLMLLSISNFVNQGMEQYFVFKNAMVYNNIEVLDLYTYRVGLQLSDYSFATTVGILKSVISVSLLFVANAIAKKVRGTSII